MAISLELFQEHVHGEDEERTELDMYLNSAKSYVTNFINRDINDLNENELKTLDMCILQVATNWYLNRDGSAKGATKTYSGINIMLDTLRMPSIGGDSR